MDVTTFKLIALFTIFFIGLAGGLLSRTLSAGPQSEFYFSSGNAFAGGVFLGAGLIHMLPDAQAGFNDFLGDSSYPWFAVTCALGFLLILFLEQVLLRHDHGRGRWLAAAESTNLFYPYVLMLVLSLHSIITGIALGTESRVVQAAILLIAVLAHKGTAAFALGISMLRSHMSGPRMRALVVCFACMTPLGVILGWGFMYFLTGRAEEVFEAVFDALAAGTFLYIALLDIMQEEFSVAEGHGIKFLLVLAGFGVMALVAIWT